MAGNIPFDFVNVTGGFWEKIQRRNREVTMGSVYDRFYETGRIGAFRCDWKEGEPLKPHYFWDSDVAKWMEAAAYCIRKKPDASLEAQVEALIDCIEANQGEDGYFNIYHQVVEPEMRFKDRNHHELYCAGHLMEAAVAWADTTGRERFLNCMRRYADYIEKIFVIEGSAAFTTPGHEEIELALVKLWTKTGEARYLQLAEFLLNKRGDYKQEERGEGYVDKGSKNIQDHKPVREQDEAVGHAVRAMYLYCAMADVAAVTKDAELINACEKLWKSTAERRMFITGGIGQSRFGERFTVDYDLPNRTAYAESCAAIGLAFFARRMNALSPDGKYGDVIERILYNGFLSSTNLKGDAFFYENPLEIDLDSFRALDEVGQRRGHPIPERVHVFECSCCPPNIARFVASIGDYVYTIDDNTLYVNQFMEGDADADGISVTQETNYPHDGRIKLRVSGLGGRTLAIRKPGWCTAFTLTVDGKGAEIEPESGYLRIVGRDTTEIELSMEMPLTLVAASPAVHEDAGRVVMTRGPLVYCMESVDNGPDLRDIALTPGAPATLVYDSGVGAYTIETTGTRSALVSQGALYAAYTGERKPVKLRFIPYYAFANRGVSDMLVWADIK
ncbi:MAG: glycoside hydrolase family 127 protein [Clostridiaceae bacterium]|nr:glycoside hydrolase family 127 protein [Clostridiaceae bacterium]